MRFASTFVPAALLSSLCLIPAFGSLAFLPTAIAFLFALPLVLFRRGWRDSGPKRWVWTAIFAYHLYFILDDALLHGDFASALVAMAPNFPIFTAAIIALSLNPETMSLSPRRVGQWATISVYATFFAAVLIWSTQPEWDLLGSTLTETTRANTRLQLLTGNPLLFAAGFMTLGFVSLLGWTSRGAASQAAALGALVIAIETVSIWSLSRGAMLASLPIIFATIWYIRPRPVRLFAFLIGLAASTVVLEYSGVYGSRLATISARVSQGVTTVAAGEDAADRSIGTRMQLFGAGLEAWMARPVFGHGVSDRLNAAVPYLKQDVVGNFSHLHNAFLTHLVGGGVVGLGLLLLMLVAPFLANDSCRKSTGGLSKDSRYFAWVVFLSLSGIGLSNLILNQDVSSHLFGTLLVVHLLIANHEFQPGRAKTQS